MKNFKPRQSIISALVFPVFTALIFCGCKKDETQKTCGKTMNEVAGIYSLVKIEASSGGVYSDITALMEPCVLDNKIILNTDGTAAYQDAGTACSGGSGAGGSGTWNIGSDGKLAINVGTINFSDADVTSFDCTTIVFAETEDDVQYRTTIKNNTNILNSGGCNA